MMSSYTVESGMQDSRMLVVPSEFNRNSPTVTSLMTPEQSGLWLLERMRRQIGFDSYADMKVLDFGCGVRFTQAIINTDLPFGRYVGVDVSRPMIEFLRKNVRDPRFDYYFLDAYHAIYNPLGSPLTTESISPLKERDFDLACMFSVITHQTPNDSKSIFSMLRRHVRNGDGHLFFTCFIDEAIDSFEDRSPQHNGERCFYNPQFLKELVESCGWTQIDRTPSIGPLIGDSFLYRAAGQNSVTFSTQLSEANPTRDVDEVSGDREVKRSVKEPVCIGGMHRSGTSMVTALLKECGLFLGSEDDLIGRALDNTEGFWENQNFVKLNEAVLHHFGGTWDKPPVFPARWELDDSLAPWLQSASELIQSFNSHEPWGWKDPRNSLTIPFWRRAIPSMRIVICVRNPLEVAHSLFVRGDSTSHSQFQLWLDYYRQILATTSESSRIVTHYQSYFEDAEAEIRRVAEWLGLELSSEIVESVKAQASARMRHHRASTFDLEAAGASNEVLELYQRLCDEAGPVCRQFMNSESRIAPAASDLSDKTLSLQLQRLDNQLAKSEERLRLLQEHNANLEDQLHRVSTELRTTQLQHEARLHELRASILPVIRTLDKLRAARDRLRSLFKR